MQQRFTDQSVFLFNRPSFFGHKHWIIFASLLVFVSTLQTLGQAYRGCIMSAFPTEAYASPFPQLSENRYDYTDYEGVYQIPQNYKGDIKITNSGSSNGLCQTCAGFPNSFYDAVTDKDRRLIYTTLSEVVWSGPDIKTRGYINYYSSIDIPFCREVLMYQRDSATVPFPASNSQPCSGSACYNYYTPYIVVKAPTVTTTYNYAIIGRVNGVPGNIVRGKIILIVGPPILPVSIQHHHQLVKSRSFALPQKLSEGDNFKVCADGSEGSIFKIARGGQNYSKAVIRLPGTDARKVGRFSLISLTRDSLIVRYKHPDYIETSGESTILPVNIYLESGSPVIIAQFNITVYQAPVLMIHGFQSDPSGFKQLEDTLILSGWPKPLLFRANYSLTSKKQFSVNALVVPTRIDSLLAQLHLSGIAAGKVDIIGHSMGGLLSRIYLQSSTYSFDIHKLITLNTPHSGSQFSNISKDLSFDPRYNVGLRNFLVLIADHYLDEGAMTDLAVDSDVIRSINLRGNAPGNLNYNIVPSHAIATTYPYLSKPNSSPQMDKVYTGTELALMLKINLNDVFGETTHDLIVSQTSQTAGLPSRCISVFSNQIHIGSMQNRQVIERALVLFRQPSDASVYSQTGFSPFGLTYKKVYAKPNDEVNRLFAIEDTKSTRSAAPAVKINSPIQGKIVKGGSRVQVQAVGADLTDLWLYVSYSPDTAYSGYTVGSVASHTLTIDQNEGRRSVVAIGRTLDGIYVSDTSFFYVSNKPGVDLILGTEPLLNSEATTVYPNPTSGNVVIKLLPKLSIQDLIITDLLGRNYKAVYRQINEGEYSIQLGQLTDAVYLIEVKTPNGIITRRILLKR